MNKENNKKSPLGGLGDRIYIAGKVSGEKIHKVTMKFGKAQKELEALGYEAINPLEVVNDWKATWREAMNKCIKALVDCDALLVLPDYQNSKGAMIERMLAELLEMTVYENIKEIPKN